MTSGTHEGTTRNIGSAYPFVADASTGSHHVLIGRDLSGGEFAYDPFDLYARGVITNPNMVVIGQIGRGKSAFVKSYLWRQAAFGRRAWVIDPKGEYGSLARAWGVPTISLRPGGSVRLNPLDASGADESPDRARGELVCSIAAASLGRGLDPSERTAVELAVKARSERRRSTPTLPEVVDAILNPAAESAREVSTNVAGLAADGRQVALELRRLVTGDMRGMFDGPTTEGLDIGASLVVLDLSSVFRSDALEVFMTCAMSCMQSALSQDFGSSAGGDSADGCIVVIDEAWAVLANVAVARWFQAAWKLARAWGVANVAVMHRLSDLSSAGAAGSEQVAIAEGLLSDSETRVVYAQSPAEVTSAARLLGLNSTERDLIPRLGCGVALWKIADRSFLVQHLLGPTERALVDTDGAIPAADLHPGNRRL